MLTLLYTGNLGLGHDLETIILALAKINGDLSLQAVFVGDGKAKRNLEKQIKQLKFDNVEFRPPVPLYKLSELMAEGDIHVVSQKAGTQGLIVPSKIYGVLAAGRPVLFIGPSDCEPAMIVSKSRAGVVVQSGDIDGVAEAIKKLVLNPDLRREMGKHARQYYEKNFGRDISVSRIIKAIETIV